MLTSDILKGRMWSGTFANAATFTNSESKACLNITYLNALSSLTCLMLCLVPQDHRLKLNELVTLATCPYQIQESRLGSFLLHLWGPRILHPNSPFLKNKIMWFQHLQIQYPSQPEYLQILLNSLLRKPCGSWTSSASNALILLILVPDVQGAPHCMPEQPFISNRAGCQKEMTWDGR